LITATAGKDFALTYLTSGDPAGYTLLTVSAVPEPHSLVMFAVAVIGFLLYARIKGVRTIFHSF